MPDITQVLSSSANYKQAFEEGINTILQHKTAGTFILACANMFQHPDFLHKNKHRLLDVYNEIQVHYQACAHDGKQPNDAPDDIIVMNSLIDIGLDNLQDVTYRKININTVDFLLNYNQLRSFRPARMSNTGKIQLNFPFNENGFHFNKPFLNKEIFAEGEIDGKHLCLLYNKFPFIHYHALLVANKTEHNNQYLTIEYLDFITKLQNQAQQQCPGFTVAYNSLSAGASVNHLHFHTYLEAEPLPLFSGEFKHNGGNQTYPANCLVFSSSYDAWQTIEEFHKNETPYNLLFRDNNIFCLPRKSASNKFPDIDVNMFGWSQMAGLINVDNKELLAKTTANLIILALQSVSRQ